MKTQAYRRMALVASATLLNAACSGNGGAPGAEPRGSTGGNGGQVAVTGGAPSGGNTSQGGNWLSQGGATATGSTNTGGAAVAMGGANGGGASIGGASVANGGASRGGTSTGGASVATGGANRGGTSTGGASVATGGATRGGTSTGGASVATGGATRGGTSTGGSTGVGGGASTEPKPCEAVPSGQHLAFPGAEGFGRLSPGGRGGDVCHVTNLNDSGSGSFRSCVGVGNRTVVFDVGGWITLTSNLGITVNNLTIAGQTAPGGGIGIRGTKFSVGGSNIIIRFLRVRRGIITTVDRNDAMAVASTASNVIIDHCSIGFGTDENFSMPGDEGVGPKEFTVQWSVVAFGLQRNNHSAGSLLTASNTTIHHSVYAFNSTCNPKVRSESGRPLDFVNNVVYGWNAPDPYGESLGWSTSAHAFIMGDTANGMHYANAVGNYFISHGTKSATQAFVSGGTSTAGVPTYNLYFDGNLLDGNGNGTLDVSKSDWTMVGTATRLSSRIAAPKVCSDDASAAYNKVLKRAGASLVVRDQVDDSMVASIRAQTGIKIQDETDLGVGDSGYGTLASGTAPTDTDRDGMPDSWENQRGLAASNASDRNGDDDNDGYTNLEEYLNELAAPAFVF